MRTKNGESVNRSIGQSEKTISPFTYSPLRAMAIHPFTDKNGFSLIEIIMIIVVVSIAIPALLILIGGEAKRGIEPELRVTATNVAQQLLEEIRTKCWDENLISGGICGAATMTSYSDIGITAAEVAQGETCGTTSTYDDIDDYACSSSGVPAVTVGGVSYSRSVQVCYVKDTDAPPADPDSLKVPCDTLGSGNTLGANGTNYKKVVVTVTAPSTSWGSSVVLTTVMTNY